MKEGKQTPEYVQCASITDGTTQETDGASAKNIFKKSDVYYKDVLAFPAISKISLFDGKTYMMYTRKGFYSSTLHHVLCVPITGGVQISFEPLFRLHLAWNRLPTRHTENRICFQHSVDSVWYYHCPTPYRQFTHLRKAGVVKRLAVPVIFEAKHIDRVKRYIYSAKTPSTTLQPVPILMVPEVISAPKTRENLYIHQELQENLSVVRTPTFYTSKE